MLAKVTLFDKIKDHLIIEEWRITNDNIEVDHCLDTEEDCDTTEINHKDFSQWLEDNGRFQCPFIYNEGRGNERIVMCTQTYEQYLDGTCRIDLESDLKEYLFTSIKSYSQAERDLLVQYKIS